MSEEPSEAASAAPARAPEPGCRWALLKQSELDHLFVAAWEAGDIERARDFLKAGADPEAGDSRLGSLARAARHPEFALELLLAGAALEKGEGGRGTALHWACSHFYDQETGLGWVTTLINAGANLNATDESGTTPLMKACGSGAVGAVRALLAAGADIEARNQYGWSAYLSAVEMGELGICDLLLEAGADWRVINFKGESALDMAREESAEFADQIAALQAREEAKALERSTPRPGAAKGPRSI